jgi:hypothetical protein
MAMARPQAAADELLRENDDSGRAQGLFETGIDGAIKLRTQSHTGPGIDNAPFPLSARTLRNAPS